jgi:hypothetical protein
VILNLIWFDVDKGPMIARRICVVDIEALTASQSVETRVSPDQRVNEFATRKSEYQIG